MTTTIGRQARKPWYCYASGGVAKEIAIPLLAALVILLAGSASQASAASAGPGWSITSVALPTNFAFGSTPECEAHARFCDSYIVDVTNTGTSPSTGPIVVKDRLPPGMVFTEIQEASIHDLEFENEERCTPSEPVLQCTYESPLPPGDVLQIVIKVRVTGSGEASVINHAEVEGGGAPTAAATSEPSTARNTVNAQDPAFGAQDFSVGVHGPNGASNAQAGEHPSALTTTIDYTTIFDPVYGETRPVQEAKSEIVDFPLGFAGNPLAAGQCPESDLIRLHCSAASQVGVVVIEKTGPSEHFEKIYSIVPEKGYPAMFGFEYAGVIVIMRARVVPTPSGYALSVSVPYVPRSSTAKVKGLSLTFFGDPEEQNGGGLAPAAFFTNPSDCTTGPLNATLEMDSWVNPQHWVSKQASMYEASPTQGVSGCDMLQFDPTVEVMPEETLTDTPTGYEVDLKVPQMPNLAPALATPDLKNAEVALPEGVSVSPGAANGLVACRETGDEGINITHGWGPTGEQPLDPADPEAMEIAPDGLPHVAPGHCPLASQIGTVEVATPLLANPLKGHVYVAEPLCGGAVQPSCSDAEAANGNLFRLYLEAAGSGVIVKLIGTVSVNPATGRLTTHFDENPQLPFSELKLDLNGGSRAPLANPQSCGEVRTTSVLEPWSAPESGSPATPFSSFAVSGCASPTPFTPAFSAGTLTPAAGAFSPFTLTFSRHDGEQDLSGLTVNMPAGLIGKIAGIAQCPEAQANAGTCAAASKVGAVTASAGAGSAPFWQSGPVYLTGPFKGAPFGLSVVVPAKAGPYNLGDIVVRAAIYINPTTAALTVVSNPLPQIIDGVPLRVQTVNVTVGSEGSFTFNPTSCVQQSIRATITSAQGAAAGVSSPFAAAGCKNLPFKPDFSAATIGKTSKALGASLSVKIISAGLGQSDIAKVDVEIPKALPTQLKTLNKACTEAQFNSDPADCPPASDVAQVTVHTPLLNSPLTGPAYLVSHGNAAFPYVEMVLQGEGVELVIDGHTQIKRGVTYSHFETVPDAPFTSFEFNSPQGELALFTAEGDLCDQKLVMPVTLTGQNGAVLKHRAPIEVAGCSSSLSVVSSKLKQKTLTLSVYAPGAGKVTAGGKGVSSGSKTYSGREVLTFKLKQKKAGKLKTKIKLAFTPSKGKKQTKAVNAKFTR
ncbi:MAG TPA: hypothetical protein VFG23_00090 [Polyangia bacterium]|nr:hypothetical protein [Polyangia bacterium]